MKRYILKINLYYHFSQLSDINQKTTENKREI